MFNNLNETIKTERYRDHSVNTYAPKQIGRFSYSTHDRIGTGYSSIVYRGKNIETSNEFSEHGPAMSILLL